MPQIAKTTESKICPTCNQSFNRKRFSSGTLEDYTRYMSRTYCSKECSYAVLNKGDDVSLGTLHERARKLILSHNIPNICSVCGTDKQIQVHHKDENPANNTLENLQLLCSSCHLKLHWADGEHFKKPKKSCVICGDKVKGLNYCQKHYIRFKKHGDPLICLRQHKR